MACTCRHSMIVGSASIVRFPAPSLLARPDGLERGAWSNLVAPTRLAPHLVILARMGSTAAAHCSRRDRTAVAAPTTTTPRHALWAYAVMQPPFGLRQFRQLKCCRRHHSSLACHRPSRTQGLLGCNALALEAHTLQQARNGIRSFSPTHRQHYGNARRSAMPQAAGAAALL